MSESDKVKSYSELTPEERNQIMDQGRDQPEFMILFFLAIAVVVGAARVSTFGDYIGFSSLAGLLFLAIWSVLEFRKLPKPRYKNWSLSALLIMAVVSFVGGIVFYSLLVTVKTLAPRVLAAALSPTGQLIVFAAIVLVLAGALFYVRLRFRVAYGMSEVAAGIVVAVSRFSSSGATQPHGIEYYLALLTAGVYLIVRGLDNIHQGWRAQSEKWTRENELLAQKAAAAAHQTKIAGGNGQVRSGG